MKKKTTNFKEASAYDRSTMTDVLRGDPRWVDQVQEDKTLALATKTIQAQAERITALEKQVEQLEAELKEGVYFAKMYRMKCLLGKSVTEPDQGYSLWCTRVEELVGRNTDD